MSWGAGGGGDDDGGGRRCWRGQRAESGRTGNRFAGNSRGLTHQLIPPGDTADVPTEKGCADPSEALDPSQQGRQGL